MKLNLNTPSILNTMKNTLKRNSNLPKIYFKNSTNYFSKLNSNKNSILNNKTNKSFSSKFTIENTFKKTSDENDMIAQVISNPNNLFNLDLNKNTIFNNLNKMYSYLFSEYGFFKYRVLVEVSWLKCLSKLYMKEKKDIDIKKNFNLLDSIYNNFDNESFFRIKEIEKTTNHDVKAVEYYIKEQLDKLKLENEYYEFTHFCCTSEDINNTSLSLIMKEFLNMIYFPVFDNLINSIRQKSSKFANVPMISRTHGQPATPTTFGKEIANFAYRSNELAYKLKQIKIKSKFNGAVGNFNAHFSVDENVNWTECSRHFIEDLGLEFNPYSTQIESHDSFCEILNYIQSINSVLIDLSRDFYSYSYLGYFSNISDDHQNIASICNKVEGELILANNFSKNLSLKLPVSRFQRDLSDSTTMRNFGVAFNHSIKAMILLTEVFDKIQLNTKVLSDELNDHWELLAEPMQTILRFHGFKNPYELLKEETRGKKFTKESYENLIKKLDISESVKEKLLKLTPENYLGNSVEMSKNLKDYIK
jgi:adenylosuccinate lyase